MREDELDLLIALDWNLHGGVGGPQGLHGVPGFGGSGGRGGAGLS